MDNFKSGQLQAWKIVSLVSFKHGQSTVIVSLVSFNHGQLTV
jgi:hypothetical protein